MAIEGRGQAYVNVPLTKLAARRKCATLIADYVFPQIAVPRHQGVIFKRDAFNEELKIGSVVRAPGTRPRALSTRTPDQITFNITDHSLSDVLTYEEKINAFPAIIGETNKVERLYRNLDLASEVEFVAMLAANLTGNQTDALSSGNRFDAATPLDPVPIITSYYSRIEKSVGASPNAIALSVETARAMVLNPKFNNDRMAFWLSPEQRNTSIDALVVQLKVALNLEYVFIAEGAYYNTAKAGVDTPSYSSIWGSNVLIFRYEEPNLEYSGLGLTPVSNGSVAGPGTEMPSVMLPNAPGTGPIITNPVNGPDGMIGGRFVTSWRNPTIEADEYFAHWYYARTPVNTGAGVWLTSTTG